MTDPAPKPSGASGRQRALAWTGLVVSLTAAGVGLKYGLYKSGEVRIEPKSQSLSLQCGPDGWDYGVGGDGPTADEIMRSKATVFPPDFMWGTATSSYQIEGAVDEGGRGKSIWDTFSHTKGKVYGNENGDYACEHYKRYKEDVALIKSLGIKYYRFSIAWPRIIPSGEGPVNDEGVQFYSDLVDELIANGIEPVATLYHWDLPQGLQDKYDGWLGAETADAFEHYANVTFARLGDRVKRWLTFNEPWCTAVLGYGNGGHAPGLKDLKKNPYIAGHTQLRAHAKAVKLYRKLYQNKQKGKIGITLNSDFKQAACNTSLDREAANRQQIQNLAWFADPVFFGDYPQEMRDVAGSRLPEFTAQEKADLKGSTDFFGLNHYTTTLVLAPLVRAKGDYYADAVAYDGLTNPDWPKAESGWLRDVPWGFRRLLVWIKNRYHDPDIIVTENGWSELKESDMTDEEALDDKGRQQYIKGFISEMYKAIVEDRVSVKGYFVWSLLDNFEWGDGYRPRFGIVRVNFTTQERFPKGSAKMYAEMVQRFSGVSLARNDTRTNTTTTTTKPSTTTTAGGKRNTTLSAPSRTSDPPVVPVARRSLEQAVGYRQVSPVEEAEVDASGHLRHM